MIDVRRAASAARRTSLYLVVPAISAAAPLIAIPAVTSRFGAAGWAVVAVAISIGTTAAVICDLGWGTIGPQEVARDPRSARAVYASSLGSKVFALLLLVPLTAEAALVVSTSDPLASMMIAVGTLLNALNPAWFFIGQGKPGLIMRTDTLPRLVISVASACLIALGAPLFVYGAGAMLAAVLVFVLGARAGRLPMLPPESSIRAAPSVIRRQVPLIFGNVISTAFTSAPASILAWSAGPLAVATFSAVDRPMRMGLNVLGGVPARLQSWVGVAEVDLARRRSQQSILINLVLGFMAMLGFFLLAPPVTAILFTGSVNVTPALAALGGVLAGQICFSRGLGLALVAADRANSISTAVSVGAVVGVALLIVLPPRFGAEGALCAIIAAEAAMIAVQLLQLRTAWRGFWSWKRRPSTEGAIPL